MRTSGKIANAIDGLIAKTKIPDGLNVTLRGMVQGMRVSFQSFAIGLCLALVLLYLILVAQFQSFIDPFIILVAVPPGLTGVILTLWLSGTTLNVMSLMGVGDAGRHRGFQQYSDRGVHAATAAGGHGGSGRGSAGLPRPVAARPDDLARHHHRAASHGAENGRGQRGVCAAGRAPFSGVSASRWRSRCSWCPRLTSSSTAKEARELACCGFRRSN